MKAVLCKEYGDPSVLVVEDVPSPPVEENEVRIAIHAAGVNFPDVLMVAGKYQFKPPFPFSPGLESAGEVIEVGAGVTGVKAGDRVMANHGWGGFAEEVSVPADAIVPMPDSMSYEDGAGMLLTYGTTYHALVDRGELRAGEILLVHGAGGGVGLTAVELGKHMGATVIATAGSAGKLAVAKEYGADHLINYRDEDIRERVKELTGGQGADVIYDPVGGDVMDASMRCIKWGGRVLVIGFAAGRIAEIPSNLILLKGCAVVGVFWGAFRGRDPKKSQANFAEICRLYDTGKIKPHISKAFPLDDAADALVALVNREVTGKAILTTGTG